MLDILLYSDAPKVLLEVEYSSREGSPLEVECKTDANPQPVMYTWKKNQQPFLENSKVSLSALL